MVPNWIEQRAALTPNRVALTYKEDHWTFLQLANRSKEYAQQLQLQGVQTGDRVAIYGQSSPQLVMVIFACMQLQVEMVMLNLRLSKRELAYQIEDAQVKKIIVQDELMKQLPEVDVDFVQFSTIQQACEMAVPVNSWGKDSTMTIMYTSGTTSKPKGVRQTVQNHLASATSSLYNTGLIEDEAWICTMPIFHISGFSMLCKSILHGVRIDLYEKFDEEKVVAQLIDGSATRMSVVAVMLEKILSHLEASNAKVSPRFQLALAGGGPIPKSYLQRAAALHLKVAQTYGMTETSSQTATLSNEDALRKLGSAGKALMFNEIKIEGTSEPFVHGEICIRGDHVTPGYIGQHAHLPTTVDGWLHTGDIGFLDDEGYLFVADRRSDLIISGGENIYPAEVESVLSSHEAVEAVGVCGLPDEKWGQCPAAFVLLKKEVSEDVLRAFCEENLAKYKVPKTIHFVDELPRNGAGKMMRRKLHELL